MINREQAAQHLRTTKDLREACIRNGWRVPALKSALCTRQFLLLVKSQEVYALRIVDTKMHCCAQPPTIQILQQELIDQIANNLHTVTSPADRQRIEILLAHLTKRAADADYILDMLMTLTNGNHIYFAKNYVPPKVVRKTKFQDVVTNENGFFDNLPIKNTSGKCHASLLLTKPQRRMKEIAKAEWQMQMLVQRIRQMESELSDAKRQADRPSHQR